MNTLNKNTLREEAEVWIGLATLIPLPGCDLFEGGDVGAIVNVLTMASDESDYKSKIQVEVNNMKLEVQEVEDIEPFSSRVVVKHPSDEIIELAEEVRLTGEIQFGTFHVFGQE